MELSYARCEQILNTLPIGYYTGRRIGISLDKEEKTSFYSPLEDKIIVSYPIIAHRMGQMPENSDEEEAVRSMLYHEVSHAILTPKAMHSNDIVNIMEDERIESVLRNYYHNVDFRKQLYDLHGGHVPKATNTMKAYYNAVRFGLGTGAIQKEVNRILKQYAPMNRNTKDWEDNRIDIARYQSDINNLYHMVDKEFAKNPDAFNEPKGGGEGEMKQMDSVGNGNNNDSDKKKSKSTEQKESNGSNDSKESNGSKESNDSKESDESDDANNEQENNGKADGEPNTEDMPEKIGDAEREIQMNPEELKRMVGSCLCDKPNFSEKQQKKLTEFQKAVETIIGNFNKKNSGGSGINAYSGVFNPRAVARQDYRFFERSMSTQGNNRFGTCHLNLIIDCSGSFCYNEDLTNGILAVLTEVERKNRNFSMDVVFINHQLKVCESVRDRVMNTWGGNRIPSDMKEILLKLQKPQTCNYNIVLFDGDAMCDNTDIHGGMDGYVRRFGVFDMKQTTLITDPDNQRYLGKGFSSTKVVVTRNYTDELVKNIQNALTVAFG